MNISINIFLSVGKLPRASSFYVERNVGPLFILRGQNKHVDDRTDRVILYTTFNILSPPVILHSSYQPTDMTRTLMALSPVMHTDFLYLYIL